MGRSNWEPWALTQYCQLGFPRKHGIYKEPMPLSSKGSTRSSKSCAATRLRPTSSPRTERQYLNGVDLLITCLIVLLQLFRILMEPIVDTEARTLLAGNLLLSMTSIFWILRLTWEISRLRRALRDLRGSTKSRTTASPSPSE